MKSTQKLAANFNRLLGIKPGHFGHNTKGKPGAGTQRRLKREREKRAWQAKYYADHHARKQSRQVIFRAKLEAHKQARISAAEFARRKMDAIHRGKKGA